MIEIAIQKAFELANTKGWDKTFWAIDIHETMIEPNYIREAIPTVWYPLAKKALQLMSNRTDICNILFTCSHPSEITKYLDFFKQSDIYFDYINKNPEVKTQENGYGYYEDKMYINVLMDDKAGFNANIDWKYVIAALDKKDHLFNPIDWGFELVDDSTYIYNYSHTCLLRISYSIYTNTWKFESVFKESGYYDIKYYGPLLSMRHGDQTIQTIFKQYKLTDKTYN